MHDARCSKDPEDPESRGGCGVGEDVKEANEYEGRDVLKVIQVVSERMIHEY